MFLDISKKHSIDVPSSIFIGDTEIDQETAYLGKMKFMLASYNQVVGISTAQAIINAVHEIKS
jgi:histidinol phosphatase-like enzyme